MEAPLWNSQITVRFDSNQPGTRWVPNSEIAKQAQPALILDCLSLCCTEALFHLEGVEQCSERDASTCHMSVSAQRVYGEPGTLYARCGGVFGVAAFADRCMDRWMADH